MRRMCATVGSVKHITEAIQPTRRKRKSCVLLTEKRGLTAFGAFTMSIYLCRPSPGAVVGAYCLTANRTDKRSRAIAIDGVFRFRLVFMRRTGRPFPLAAEFITTMDIHVFFFKRSTMGKISAANARLFTKAVRCYRSQRRRHSSAGLCVNVMLKISGG
jgi:hypothetical protein